MVVMHPAAGSGGLPLAPPRPPTLRSRVAATASFLADLVKIVQAVGFLIGCALFLAYLLTGG